MTHHVAVGVDGSPESLIAAEWAAQEALNRRSALQLVQAQVWPTSLTQPVSAIDTRREWAEARLREVSADLRNRYPVLEITNRRHADLAVPTLAAAAREADLLVLGSRGLGRVGSFLLGAVSLATLRATDQPVVLARRSAAPEETREATWALTRDVLLGVDLYRTGDAVIEFAFDAAMRRGCTLQVLHAWKQPLDQWMVTPGTEYGKEAQRQSTQALQELLLPWQQKFPTVQMTVNAVPGPAAQRLTAAAAEAGLVVVGRRVPGAPLPAHIGPVTHAVLHHSPAPVAVIAHH